MSSDWKQLSRGENGDRYSLEALLALYEYEPDLRDLYVEGATDVAFLRWFLQERGINSVGIFAVGDRVEIPRDVLEDFGLSSGEKQRVVALALCAQASLGSEQKSITCVADADTDHLIGPIPLGGECLIITEIPALENYALEEAPMTRVLQKGLAVSAEVDVPGMLSILRRELREILAARAALHAFGIGCLADVAGACDFGAHETGKTTLEVLNRSFSKVRRDERPIPYPALVEWAIDLLTAAEELDQHGRGHDIAPVVTKMLGVRGALANAEALEAVMRSSVDVSDLLGRHTFVLLEGRLAGYS